MAEPVRLIVRGLRKAYGDTQALDGLDLIAEGGEVLGIAGPNGAGKSTLVRILAGEERQDEGEIELHPRPPGTPAGAVAVVHQEPQLFPNLTVGENLLVGREGARLGRLRVPEPDRRLLEELELQLYVDRPLSDCSLAIWQRTEIARALARDARVFLFDEPNSALTDEESEELFARIATLSDAGHAVLLVSHRLGDLAGHASRVVVIRDGKVRDQLGGERLTQEELARSLVAEDGIADDRSHQKDEAVGGGGEVLFAYRDWSAPDRRFTEVDLDLEDGEVVALIGVEGSGGRELLRSFAGLEPAGGSVTGPDAKRVLGQTSYVPATRDLSLFSNLDVGENLVARLDSEIFTRFGILRPRRARAKAAAEVRRFQVKTASTRAGIRSLSGGNQQKIAIAAAIAPQPRLLLLEEPTRGVDLGSRREIYRLLREFAATGNAVVAFCTEISEVFELADKVHVVSDGRLSDALPVGRFATVGELAASVGRLEQHRRAEQSATLDKQAS